MLTQRFRGSILTASLACTGCASTIGSSYDTAQASLKDLSGIPYSLPRVMLTATLLRESQGVSLEIGEPAYSGDPTATYLLKYVRRGSSNDIFNVSVDPKTSLLTSVGGEADDKTAQVVVAIAKAVSGIGKTEAGLTAPGRQVLYRGTFDPSSDDDIKRINGGIRGALDQLNLSVAGECKASREADAKVEKKKGQAPAVFANCSLVEHWPASSAVTVKKQYTPFGVKETTATMAPCTIGLCTRIVRPAVLSIEAGSAELGSSLFHMPNQSAAIPVDLTRASFVKSTHTITLQNGLIATAATTKDSEALAIANIPFDVLKAVFQAPAELIQLKVDLKSKDTALVTAETQKLTAEKAKLDAEKALEEARHPKKDGAPTDPDSDKTETAAVAPDDAPSDKDDAGIMMKVVLPKLGQGSGAELPAPVALGNRAAGAAASDAQAADAAGEKAKKAKAADKAAAGDLGAGGHITGGSDGPQKK